MSRVHTESTVSASEGGSLPVASWDHIYGRSFPELLATRWSNEVWQCFSKYIPPQSYALEIGAGTGRILCQAAKELKVDGVGIDPDRQSSVYANQLAEYLGVSQRCKFIQADGFAVPYPDNSFDIVLSEGVIEHFSPAASLAMVREHARVCRPGGLVLISVPNLLNLPLTWHKWRTGQNYNAYPERSFTKWGLLRLVRRACLEPIATDGFASTIGLEWFIHPRLKMSFIDAIIHRSRTIAALVGFEILVVARKRK